MVCEIAAREMDAKLLLGCAAARRGFDIILGSIRAVYGAQAGLPRGIWQANCIDRTKAMEMRELRRNGYRVICCDEEGFMQIDDDHYIRNRLSGESFAEVERMLAASDDHVRIIDKAYPEVRDKVVQTGNPRTDLLRPELRAVYEPAAARLRERFGRFILVNTNFAKNALFGEEMMHHMRIECGGMVDDRDRAWWAERDQYESELFDEFRAMLVYVATEMPDVPVILRPHPQENADWWREQLKAYPNISVIYEGNVHTWAVAAAAVVHTNCTTGVESHMLGRPVFAYRPIRNEVHDLWLPNAVSEEVTDRVTLKNRLQDVLAANRGNGRVDYRHRDALERHFGPLEGRFAYDKVVDVIEAMDIEPDDFPPVRFPSPFLKGDMREMVRLTAQRWPRVSRRVFGEGHLDYWTFDRQKFPPHPLETVRRRVEQYGALSPALAGVRVRELGRDLFHLSAERSAR